MRLALTILHWKRNQADHTRRGGGFEYLHRSPASRRSWRKGNPVPGGITGPPCSWGIWGPGPPGWGGGSLESETVKIWWSPRYSDPRMTALMRASSNCKRQTRPHVREGAPHQQTRNCLSVIKMWCWAPDGRPTVGRNITLTLKHNMSAAKSYSPQARTGTRWVHFLARSARTVVFLKIPPTQFY
jgi:hypothetical protein